MGRRHGRRPSYSHGHGREDCTETPVTSNDSVTDADHTKTDLVTPVTGNGTETGSTDPFITLSPPQVVVPPDMIMGVAVALSVLLAFAVVLLLYICYRKKKKSESCKACASERDISGNSETPNDGPYESLKGNTCLSVYTVLDPRTQLASVLKSSLNDDASKVQNNDQTGATDIRDVPLSVVPYMVTNLSNLPPENKRIPAFPGQYTNRSYMDMNPLPPRQIQQQADDKPPVYEDMSGAKVEPPVARYLQLLENPVYTGNISG